MSGSEQESAAIERPPNKFNQALEAARDDPTRRELTKMVHGLSHVVEIVVDGEAEDWRPTTIMVGFDDEGYRVTSDVIDIMREAGWRPEDVTFAPYNRITFEEVDADG